MGWGDFTAADGLVIAMLVVMFLAMGVVALLFLTIRRSAARRNHEVEDLLDELSAEENAPHSAPVIPENRAAASEPWERDGDWWKS